MNLAVCRRVYVDMDAVIGGHITLHQPAFKTASDKETVLLTGLTSLSFLPSRLLYSLDDTDIANMLVAAPGNASADDVLIPAADLADLINSQVPGLVLTPEQVTAYTVAGTPDTAAGDLLIPSASIADYLTLPSAPVYVRCSNATAELTNGANTTDSGSAPYDDWAIFNVFDPALGVKATVSA